MKLKFFFYLLALLLVAVWVLLFVATFEQRGVLFYVSEGIITASLLFLIVFYRKVVDRKSVV